MGRVRVDARYWYFITQVDMGETMSLNPRCPLNKCDEEPRLPRICVAPTAAHCMTAISLYAYAGGGKVHVYRTRRKVQAIKPWDVYDSHITKEHWLTSKTRFTRVETLELSNCEEAYRDWFYVGDEKDQYRSKRAIISWCKRRDPRLSTVKHANQLWRKL